jgi:hypothetical protein
MKLLIDTLLLFLFVASTETLNGIARTVYLNKRVGAKKAKQISMVSALLLCFLICCWFISIRNIDYDLDLILLGCGLSTLMAAFDILLGRFVIKAKWRTILEEFDPTKGNLLTIGMIIMALCPLLASKFLSMLQSAL